MSARLNIAKTDMRLTSHCLAFRTHATGYYIQDWTVCREQHVQSALEVVSIDLVVQVLDVKGLIWRASIGVVGSCS